METLAKVDPSVPFFFKSMDDIQVELEATVRNPDGPKGSDGAAKRVHYAQQQHSVGVGGTATNDYDEDDRDDDAGYGTYQSDRDGTYQSSPTYAGYGAYAGPASAEEEQLAHLLNLQPQEAEANGDRRSNGSTDAVQDE